MRRVVPWALLLLIGIGTGLGAALGAAGSPGTSGGTDLTGATSQKWLAGVLAATTAAGTAHLHYSQITESPHPTLRGTATGSGVVDFTTGSFRVRETDRSTEMTSQNGGPTHPEAQTTTTTQIAIGRAVYQNFGLPGFPVNWMRQSIPRNKGELGLGSADGFGDVLSGLTGPFTAVTVTDLGSAVVSGEPTTRYLVQTQFFGPGCPAPAHAKRLHGRATVWVDGQGRLAQVRVDTFFSGKLPASFVKKHPGVDDQPLGPFTETSTLRLSAFGAPVHISRPALSPDRSGSSFGIAYIANCR